MLLAIVHPEGFSARLMMLDSQGRVLVQSDGLSPSDPDSVIDQYLTREGITPSWSRAQAAREPTP